MLLQRYFAFWNELQDNDFSISANFYQSEIAKAGLEPQTLPATLSPQHAGLSGLSTFPHQNFIIARICPAFMGVVHLFICEVPASISVPRQQAS